MNKTKILGYTIKKKSINGSDYIDFFKKYINPNRRTHILMDNATIHKTKAFTNYIKKTKNKTLYNAPNNPEGNPIEHLNNKVKCYIKQQDIDTEEKLIKAIEDSFKTITKKDLKNFYKCSFATF